MKLQIAAIGRLKGAERTLAEDYLGRAGRLGRGLGVTGISVDERPESTREGRELRMREEADALRGALPAGAFAIALDEGGKTLSSRDFAQRLQDALDRGEPAVSFVIGGPDGLHAELLEQVDLRLSFGRATWPHRLVRAMLAEQIYRALTILVNHPYHRD